MSLSWEGHGFDEIVVSLGLQLEGLYLLNFMEGTNGVLVYKLASM